MRVPRGAGRGLAEPFAQLADFGVGARKQAGDLGLERASVDDLAERGIGGQRKKITGHVEGAGPQRAGIGLLFHLRGLWRALLEKLEDSLGGCMVFGEERLDGPGELSASG